MTFKLIRLREALVAEPLLAISSHCLSTAIVNLNDYGSFLHCGSFLTKTVVTMAEAEALTIFSHALYNSRARHANLESDE